MRAGLLYPNPHYQPQDWSAILVGRPLYFLRMSVENVPAVVNIKLLKGQFITHKFYTGWTVGVVKRVERKKSVAGQFAVKYQSDTYCWTKKLNQEDYRVDKNWVLLAVVKE